MTRTPSPLLVGLAVALAGALAPTAALAQADQDSAQATFLTFQRAIRQAELGDADSMARAVACLDLSGVAEADRADLGPRRARELAQLLTLVPLIPEALIPSDPNGDPFVLYQDPDKLGQVELDFVDEQWRFTAPTVRAVPAMLEAARQRNAAQEAREVGQPAAGPARPRSPPAAEDEGEGPRPEYEHASDWLRDHVPPPMQRQAFLLEYWQWAGLGLLCLIGAILDRLVIGLLSLLVLRSLRRQGMDVDAKLTRRSLRPFGMLAMASFWWLGLAWLGLHADVLNILTITVKTVALIAGVWGSYRLVDIVCNALERKALRSESKFDDLLVPLIRKSLKVFVAAFGLVFVADTLNFSISSLLAGLGLGGLAFALAAQDTVKNLFGSLTVVLDRPFEVGDWVIIDGTEGCVEEVGFRSTRIRTFYNSLISIPNAKLLTATVDNMGKRRYRRWSTTLSVAYRTPPDRLEALCEGIRELVRQHPYTRKDYYQVWVNGLADSSIQVLLYVFWETPDWTGELREKQRLILDILRLCQRLGVEIAYPTQTLYMSRSDGNGAGKQDVRPITSAEHLGRAEARAILDAGRETPTHARPTIRLEAGPMADLTDSDEDGGA